MEDEQEEIWETNETHMDYRKMKQNHETAGYRKGHESGTEANLQQGFNQGFAYGANISKEWGKLRGAVSALLSFVSAKSLQDVNPNITAEITELLAQIIQMETHALNVQAMQGTMENRMNQAQHSAEPFKMRTEMGNVSKEPNNSEEEHKLSSAFETLHTQDKNSGIGDLEVKCDTFGKDVDTENDSMDTSLPSVSSHCSDTVQATKTDIAEVENLWSKIASLADKIGIDRQKILLVKDI